MSKPRAQIESMDGVEAKLAEQNDEAFAIVVDLRDALHVERTLEEEYGVEAASSDDGSVATG